MPVTIYNRKTRQFIKGTRLKNIKTHKEGELKIKKESYDKQAKVENTGWCVQSLDKLMSLLRDSTESCESVLRKNKMEK